MVICNILFVNEVHEYHDADFNCVTLDDCSAV